MTFNVNDFKATLDAGILPKNRYLFLANPPLGLLSTTGQPGQIGSSEVLNNQYASSRIRFMSPAITLPGKEITTHQIKRYGYGPYESKPHTPTFNTINIEIQVDGEGHMFHFLHRWLQLIINTDFIRNTSIGPGGLHFFEVAYKDQYAVDSEIWVFNRTDDITPRIRIGLYQCFPVFIGDEQIAWNRNNDVFTLMTTWSFFTWAPLLDQGVFQGLTLPEIFK